MGKDVYKKWAQTTKRFRWAIVGFWGTVVVLGFFFALKFLKSTTGTYECTVETPSSIAKREIVKYFPALASADVEVTLLRSNDPNNLVTDGPIADALQKVYVGYKVCTIFKHLLSYPTSYTNVVFQPLKVDM